MIGTYGIARVSTATVTDASVQFKEDTDLGIVAETQTSANVLPGTGVNTFSGSAAGNGYTIGKSRTLIQASSTGNGGGVTVQADIIEGGGIFKTGSVLPVTGSFQLYQDTLQANFDAENPDPYTYARKTSDGSAMGETTLTSTALASTSPNGTGATFIVEVRAGLIQKVTVSALGSGYGVGDVITITEATLEDGAAFGGGFLFQGDLQVTVTEDSVFGMIQGLDALTLISSGFGHAVGDVITLSEQGSTFVGTGGLTVGTISVADNTPGDTIIYPTGVINTSGAVGPIQVIDMGGNTVVLGACQPGVIRKFAFQQVLGAGTGPGVGLVTVLY
jgi:hypothetical protein|tara:strand:+ start:1323 stop:2318 length:996 start_codon:yes stop_codon:yes gene_type:complete